MYTIYSTIFSYIIDLYKHYMGTPIKIIIIYTFMRVC